MAKKTDRASCLILLALLAILTFAVKIAVDWIADHPVVSAIVGIVALVAVVVWSRTKRAKITGENRVGGSTPTSSVAVEPPSIVHTSPAGVPASNSSKRLRESTGLRDADASPLPKTPTSRTDERSGSSVRPIGARASTVDWDGAILVSSIDARLVETGNWIAPGRTVEIHGRKVSGGMLYVGPKLRSVVSSQIVDPCLVNPRLPATKHRRPSTGIQLPYWPSYSEISDVDRGAMLDWLATGRSDARVEFGFVFIFFYGLERRILIDAMHGAVDLAELKLLRDEIARIVDLYGVSGSVRGYGSELRDVVDAILAARTDDIPAKSSEQSEAVLKVLLGREVALRGTISPLILLQLLLLKNRQPAVARRCPKEFSALFAKRAASTGLTKRFIEVGRPPISWRYRPASASFGKRDIAISVNWPDVTTHSAFEEAWSLANECATSLAPFSRFVDRDATGRSSIRAAALLPEELLDHDSAIEAGAMTMSEMFGSLIGSGEQKAVAADDILNLWQNDLTVEKISKGEMTQLAELAQRLGFAFEPDARFGAPPLKRGGKAIVFRQPTESLAVPTPGYANAMALMQLAVAVANSDGDVSRAEIEPLERQMAKSLGLDEPQQRRLRAYVEWLVVEPPTLSGLSKKLESTMPEQRRHVARLLADIAATDGTVTPDEVKMLTKVYKILSLDPALVHTDLHAAAIALGSVEDIPVVVAPQVPDRSGFRIPDPPLKKAAVGVQLNDAMIEKKLRESAAVAGILGQIFVDSDDDDQRPKSAEIVPSHVVGLDNAHATLATRLKDRQEWSRGDFDDLARELKLMPDGAIDRINDAACDRCGNPLIEGDDPLTIDVDVMREFIP